MTRWTMLTAALAIALVGALPSTTTAQNPQERTFLTFSGTVEMPGVTLPAGTYVFKLADTGSRNVVQVFDRDEKKILGQWLFVQAERPEVSQETVVMFKETAAGTPPAVHYWYFPGERVGKEFVYPKSQALKIAQRTQQPVLSTEGEIAANPRVAAIDPSGREVERQQAAAPRAVDLATPAPRAIDVPAQVEANAAQGGAGRSNPSVTSQRQPETTRAEVLPQTASPLGLVGLVGLLSLGGVALIKLSREMRAERDR
jgi:hypothetical protein